MAGYGNPVRKAVLEGEGTRDSTNGAQQPQAFPKSQWGTQTSQDGLLMGEQERSMKALGKSWGFLRRGSC